jgi:hypothetical protein
MTKLTMNTSIPSNETNKPVKSSNSAQLLSQLKKRISSLTLKNSDSYQKIDASSRAWNADASVKDREGLRVPKCLNSATKSKSDPLSGVRRARSCNDDIQSFALYNAASMHNERAVSYHSRGRGAEAVARKRSNLIGNPQSADDLPVYGGNDTSTRNCSFLPNVLSSPRTTGTRGRKIHTSSKSSNESVNDLLSQAAAVAGRKHQKQSTSTAFSSPSASLSTRATALTRRSSASATTLSSSENIYAQTTLTAPQPAFSSSPHLLARAGALSGPNQRRRYDTAIDLTAFSKKNSNNSVTRQPSFSTPRTAEDKGMRGRRSYLIDRGARTDGGGGSSRRRPKRLIPNETVVHNTNEPPRSDRERRKHLFREDFPYEPIPSDAIMTRLYGNINIPPPPPFSNTMEEQASASYGSTATSLGNGSNKLVFKPSVISPEDLPTNGDDMSFTTEPEWTAWKDYDDRPRRKRSPIDDTMRSESSSKSKHANDDTRRSESSKSKNSTASSRQSSCNQRRDHSRRGRNHQARYSSKARTETSLPHIRNSELSSSSMHKSKSNRSRDGMSSSAREMFFSPVASPKIGRKRGETIKIKSKTSRNSPHDGVSSSRGMPSRKALHKVSDHDTFQNTMLDLSNGGFGDSYSEVYEHKTSTSLDILRTSLPKMNSTGSFNDSVRSFAEWDEKTDKDRKKKRRGKTRSYVGSERKQRSRSVDENRTGTKARRGKRSSKLNVSTIDPKSNDDKRLDVADSLEFESSLNHNRHSQKSSSNELGVKQRKSPKSLSRTNLSNESGAKQRKSPKILEKKELSHESGSLRSPTRKKNKKGVSLKSYTSLSNSTRSSRSIEQEYAVQLPPNDGAPKVALKEEKKFEGDDFFDLAISSWADDPTETFHTAASDTPSSPKEKTPSFKNETPKRKDITRKTIWQPEPISMLNAISPSSNADMAGARVPDFTSMNSSIPATDVPALPKSSKRLNFPLDFVEYQNVSPLTVASKKVARVDVQLMTSMSCLEG